MSKTYRVWVEGSDVSTEWVDSSQLDTTMVALQGRGDTVSYIEDIDMKPEMDRFIECIKHGMFFEAEENGVRRLIDYSGGFFFIDGIPTSEIGLRRSIDTHYALYPGDWKDDCTAVYQMYEKLI